jgi:hypothetical protein
MLSLVYTRPKDEAVKAMAPILELGLSKHQKNQKTKNHKKADGERRPLAGNDLRS